MIDAILEVNTEETEESTQFEYISLSDDSFVYPPTNVSAFYCSVLATVYIVAWTILSIFKIIEKRARTYER